MNAEIKGLLSFIDSAPSVFHAAESVCSALRQAGYDPLEEREIWRLKPGGRYFFTRNRSSVMAFRIPACGFAPFQIIASHGDSPAFRLKPAAGRESQGYALLNVERYGGMLMSSWMDRPLSIAGRLLVKEEKAICTRLVNVDRDLALIPNMPIHFNREANDGVSYNAQVDMMPIYGMEGADYMEIVAQSAGVKRENIVGADLFLYNRARPTVWGDAEAFFSVGRIDDLECVYAALRAFLTASDSRHIDLMCLFDNEEVGSGTKQGADSTLLAETLRRIALALDAPEQALEAAIAGSFMLSADNAHAVHPNHPEKYDAENRVHMNAGVVIKFNANQKYTSDGVSAAVFKHICDAAGVPVQYFANRSDIAGGSTLGNIANTHVSMNTVDIGLAQLAMHSACETAGTRDIDYMIRAMRAFYETHIDIRADGQVYLD